MRTIRLDLGFIGTRYEGWQSQGRGRTVQETLEQVLTKICGQKTALVGCSRTDSGVHAAQYTASFKTRSAIADTTLARALNFHLPSDIVVFRARTVKASFHARFSAKSKTYRYRIWVSKTRPLFDAPYLLWFPFGRLDLNKMRTASRVLVGKHDFMAFVDQGGEAKSTVRTIRRISIRKLRREIQIEVTGDGFLKHMIRVIAGTLIEIGRGRFTPHRMGDALRSKSRAQAGPTAKPQGLVLVKVNY